MIRLRTKQRAAVIAVLLLFTIAIIIWLNNELSKPYYSRPYVDPELWKYLGPPDETTRKAIVTPKIPQIEVKIKPSVSIQQDWPIAKVEEQFFRYLENKDVRCLKDTRLGNWNEGGWNVCLSPPFLFKRPCIVFSFGIGYDWQFDDSVANNFHCHVLAFDPSMNETYVKRSALIDFRKTGLGARNGISPEGWQMKTLARHLKDEGFWGVPVDYVKMDIEFSEWEVLRQAVRDNSLKYVKQLAFEIHTPEMYRIFKLKKNPPPPRTQQNDKSDFLRMFDTLKALEELGFKKFNYRLNPFGEYTSVYSRKVRSCCYDLHFINVNFLSKNSTKYVTESPRYVGARSL
ncbi:probable methyltransferase-like protein 24 isoform X2 [Physella acuta]|nr:probable methyltransferase-like protein 24 isoform X2 [Physella acuta]